MKREFSFSIDFTSPIRGWLLMLSCACTSTRPTQRLHLRRSIYCTPHSVQESSCAGSWKLQPWHLLGYGSPHIPQNFFCDPTRLLQLWHFTGSFQGIASSARKSMPGQMILTKSPLQVLLQRCMSANSPGCMSSYLDQYPQSSPVQSHTCIRRLWNSWCIVMFKSEVKLILSAIRIHSSPCPVLSLVTLSHWH